MLTKEEKKFVIEKLKVYPKGVPSGAWGFGPLLSDGDDGDYAFPGNYPIGVQKECG